MNRMISRPEDVVSSDMTDIIIPVYNEEEILKEKRDYYQNLKNHIKVIFVDGGSNDRTVDLAKEFGQVLVSKRGRSTQMNQGAQASKAENLLFLHVDTYIDAKSLSEMNAVLENGTPGGCFRMRIEDSGFMFRLFEKVVNFRASTFGVIDGDLGLFVKRGVFDRIGQFDRLPIMEDILFSKKLRKTGKISILSNPIMVSGRKWREEGFVKTFLRYSWAYIQLWTTLRVHKDDDKKPY